MLIYFQTGKVDNQTIMELTGTRTVQYFLLYLNTNGMTLAAQKSIASYVKSKIIKNSSNIFISEVLYIVTYPGIVTGL